VWNEERNALLLAMLIDVIDISDVALHNVALSAVY